MYIEAFCYSRKWWSKKWSIEWKMDFVFEGAVDRF